MTGDLYGGITVFEFVIPNASIFKSKQSLRPPGKTTSKFCVHWGKSVNEIREYFFSFFTVDFNTVHLLIRQYHLLCFYFMSMCLYHASSQHILSTGDSSVETSVNHLTWFTTSEKWKLKSSYTALDFCFMKENNAQSLKFPCSVTCSYFVFTVMQINYLEALSTAIKVK